MTKEIKSKISLLSMRKNKLSQSYQKKKVSLIKNVFHSLFVFIRILRNGMAQELKKIKEGTYKNSFFITNVFIGVFLWWLIYSSLYLGAKINSSNLIEFLLFMVMALIVDILINPFREFKFLLKVALTIYLVGYSISILNININEFRKSEQNIHKENIREHKGNQ